MRAGTEQRPPGQLAHVPAATQLQPHLEPTRTHSNPPEPTRAHRQTATRPGLGGHYQRPSDGAHDRQRGLGEYCAQHRSADHVAGVVDAHVGAAQGDHDRHREQQR